MSIRKNCNKNKRKVNQKFAFFNRKDNFEKSFTLIELLVVIAIIGILASVVLSSFTNAKKSATDAAIKDNLVSARTEGELYYNSNNFSYTSLCSDPDVSSRIASAASVLGPNVTVEGNSQGFSYSASGAASNLGDALCHDSANNWAAIVSLKKPSAPSRGWCVDSSGISEEASSLAANAVTCP